MTKPLITIHNQETDEVVTREMNNKEFAQYELEQQLQADLKAEIVSKEIAKAALLEKLGITAEEAALLLS